MNVMYACDDNYVWIMGISLISLYENNKNIEKLNVYLLGDKISEVNKQKLTKIANKYGRQIYIIDVPPLNIPPAIVSSRWPISAFIRLYAGDILPMNMDKVLYLDCDTIITDELSLMYEENISDYICGGVKDCISAFYKENIGLKENDEYINAGVVLFNLSELRRLKINNLIENYMMQYLKLINYADQDILNGIFRKRIKVLPARYDVMTIVAVHKYQEINMLRQPSNYYLESEIRNALDYPAIIHYTTNMLIVRPWFENTNHPYATQFLDYMKVSPWKDMVFKKMVFSSKEAKILKGIQWMPKKISYRILGLIHSRIRPLIIKFKAK